MNTYPCAVSADLKRYERKKDKADERQEKTSAPPPSEDNNDIPF